MKPEWRIKLYNDGYLGTTLTTDNETWAQEFLARYTPIPYSAIHTVMQKRTFDINFEPSGIEVQVRKRELP